MLVTFNNPIIPGFAPDPSIIYHEESDTYFLVNSSFHVFPAIPIYASKGLQCRTQIGNVLNRREQVPLEEATANVVKLDTGLMAPTLRYHDGTFYMISTNCAIGPSGINAVNFYVTIQDIWSNKWSQPIEFDLAGIDPSLLFDDDGRVYFEIDIKTGKALSEAKEIWSGFAKYGSEGPHLYKKDGWYYLVIAEGGTFEHHLLSAARSKSPWGPFESYANNPVLTADGKDEYIQHTGHGDIFQGCDGQWWAAVLAVRKRDGRYPLSRETFLTPVSWPTEGWPEFAQPKMQFTREVESREPLLIKQNPSVDVIFIRNSVEEDYKISAYSHDISIRASSSDFSTPTGTSSFVGRRQRALESITAATLILGPEVEAAEKDLSAGLAVYKDSYRHALLYFDYATSSVVLSILNRVKDVAAVVKNTAIERPSSIEFKIETTEEAYSFFCRPGEGDWAEIGTMDSIEMTARDFTGPIV